MCGICWADAKLARLSVRRQDRKKLGRLFFSSQIARMEREEEGERFHRCARHHASSLSPLLIEIAQLLEFIE